MIIDSHRYSGSCLCGKTHQMETQCCIVENGSLKNIDGYLKEYGLIGKRVAVYDENTYIATADRHPTVETEIILNPENLHANEKGVELLLEQLPEKAEILIAVGSGTIHDITRYCAYQKNIKFVSCPTAASVDGFCSSVAAMTWNGCKKTLTAVAPKIVIADIDIIKKAPIYLTRSGFGDMVGKYIALTDWRISHIIKEEYYCDKIAAITLQATEAVVKSVDGIVQGEAKSYENLMYGLLLSGLAMQMIGNSRPASGAEHHISHLIEMNPKGLGIHSEALHGEKVGVGTLLVLEEYWKLATNKHIAFKDYETYSLEYLSKMYSGQMLDEIIQENHNDAGDGISAKRLQECWTDICDVLKQLPTTEEINKIYKKLDVKTKLSDIGVGDNLKEVLKNYSPTVRNRLTLMRLRRQIGLG